LLTGKPCLYVANVGLGEPTAAEENPAVAELVRYAADQVGAAAGAEVRRDECAAVWHGVLGGGTWGLEASAAPQAASGVVGVCVALEAELSGMAEAEQAEFLGELGLQGQGGLGRLIPAAYSLLGLITFLTTGEVTPHFAQGALRMVVWCPPGARRLSCAVRVARRSRPGPGRCGPAGRRPRQRQ
jgi:ribosome-binding ATPase YchF (GTP1/OBG family)